MKSSFDILLGKDYQKIGESGVNGINDKIEKYSEITKSERDFLYGLIKDVKPKKTLEIGVSSGASSCLILDAIKDIDGAHLYSVDYGLQYYRDKSKEVGFLVEREFPKLHNKWTLHKGNVVAAIINEIGPEIDFVFLDAAHGLPCECLDFLVVLPYCAAGATIVIHDINIQAVHEQTNKTPTQSTAPKILLSSVTADKIYPVYTEYELPNIGAFKINRETSLNIQDVFNALTIKWVSLLKPQHIKSTETVLLQHYDKNLVKNFQLGAQYFNYPKQQNNQQQAIQHKNSTIRQLLACLIPSKKLRKRFRGNHSPELSKTPITNIDKGRDKYAKHTYSQFGQDIVLIELFKTIDVKLPSYLDIGAHHPYCFSNTALLYKQGSRGINIEANPELIQAFLDERPNDVNICMGIGVSEGTLPYYIIEKDHPVNGFNKEATQAWLDNYSKLSISRTINLPVTTLSVIVEKYAAGKFPDLLDMDVEGMEYEILNTYDLSINGPKIAVIECQFSYKERIMNIMLKYGYFAYCKLREDIIFVRNEYKNKLY